MKSSYERLLREEKLLVFLDSETCGLHSMMVLFQYQVEDGDIVLYEIWKEPVGKTLELLDALSKHVVVGFNLAFDVFHIVKIRAIWSMLPPEWIPEEHIDEIAEIEPQAQDADCWKPYSAMDLLLHSRKGPYQSLMARKPIRIRKVPLAPVEWGGQIVPMAYAVANHLEQTIEFEGINFARTSNKDAPRWTVVDRKDADGLPDKNLADIELKFHPDGSLKSLAEHALKIPPKYVHSDIEIDPKLRPYELGYAPTALAVSSKAENWEVKVKADNKDGFVTKYAWPGVIRHHIEHWNTNQPAREYANDDIVYTRGLFYHFGEPAHGDNDSILACMVPAIRWHGFSVDLDGICSLREEAEEVVSASPINTNKPTEVREYISKKLNATEESMIAESTDKATLQKIANLWVEQEEICIDCLGDGCECCDGGVLKQGRHPAAVRAREILDIKVAAKEIQMYDKFVKAGKFHASFKIIGTLSSRMSGGDGLNAQGIQRGKKVRSKFPLTWKGMTLCGGDFDSFEVTIADAVYKDPDLRHELMNDKKIHGLFGTCVYPQYTYEQILDSYDNPDDYPEGDMYTPSKSAVFAMLYGGNDRTLMTRLGRGAEDAKEAFERWGRMFPGIGQTRRRIEEAHQPLDQPGGHGTQIFWREPQEYVETFLGFRRYFTLEYKIVRALFELAQNLPSEWRQCKIPVLRSEYRGIQTAAGAAASALYGAAGGVADSIVRAAANHEIQSVGAEITKDVQCAIWGLQPVGIHPWRVAPMNVHDEVISVTHPDCVEKQIEVVRERIEHYRQHVPLIGMSWCSGAEHWADTKVEGDDPRLTHMTFDKEELKQDA